MAITFNPDNIVKNVTISGYDKMQDVLFSQRETPTEGNRLFIIEQMLRNVGRFNAPGAERTSGSNPPSR